MPYKPEAVERLVTAIFARAGSRDEEARTVARHLVEANLVGHDSHGVVRVPSYIDWLRTDMVRANQSARIVFETDTVAVIDGQFGFGQVIGEQAMATGIRKARRHALAAVALRNSGHLGRIGDRRGQPTRDPKRFYADSGAILPIAGHKGYALSVMCEVLAGALTGGGTSHPSNPTARRVVNGMFSVLLDPTIFTPAQEFAREIRRLAEWLRASPPAAPGGEILMPGEPEERTRAERLAQGLPLDDTTWGQLLDTAASVGLSRAELGLLVARPPPEDPALG